MSSAVTSVSDFWGSENDPYKEARVLTPWLPFLFTLLTYARWLSAGGNFSSTAVMKSMESWLTTNTCGCGGGQLPLPIPQTRRWWRYLKYQQPNLILKRTPHFLVDFSSNYTNPEYSTEEHKHMPSWSYLLITSDNHYFLLGFNYLSINLCEISTLDMCQDPLSKILLGVLPYFPNFQVFLGLLRSLQGRQWPPCRLR